MVKRASDPVGRPGKPMLIWFCSMALRLSVKAGVSLPRRIVRSGRAGSHEKCAARCARFSSVKLPDTATTMRGAI